MTISDLSFGSEDGVVLPTQQEKLPATIREHERGARLAPLVSILQIRRILMRTSDLTVAGEAPGARMIEVVAALICDERDHVLLVRKRGTSAFMQPGGKRECGEDDVAALSRELREELGCDIVPKSAEAVGVFEAPAAHEPGQVVRAAVYRVRVTGKIACQAEIAELIWLDPLAPGDTPLAALTRDAVLPLSLSSRTVPQAR
jgi:8-oxo-dGTP diphosphatase